MLTWFILCAVYGGAGYFVGKQWADGEYMQSRFVRVSIAIGSWLLIYIVHIVGIPLMDPNHDMWLARATSAATLLFPIAFYGLSGSTPPVLRVEASPTMGHEDELLLNANMVANVEEPFVQKPIEPNEDLFDPYTNEDLFDPYTIAGEELLSGKLRSGAWARALVTGRGCEHEIQAAYIRIRVAELSD